MSTYPEWHSPLTHQGYALGREMNLSGTVYITDAYTFAMLCEYTCSNYSPAIQWILETGLVAGRIVLKHAVEEKRSTSIMY